LGEGDRRKGTWGGVKNVHFMGDVLNGCFLTTTSNFSRKTKLIHRVQHNAVEVVIVFTEKHTESRQAIKNTEYKNQL